jgi:hypothetical protein
MDLPFQKQTIVWTEIAFSASRKLGLPAYHGVNSRRVHTLMQGAELVEYVCNEFNIDKDRLVGNKYSTLR